MQDKKVTGNAGNEQPFLTVKSLRPGVIDGEKQGGYWENELGLKEPLLCDDCEGRFAKLEGYARRFLYGNAPPPLKKLSLGVSIISPGMADENLLDLREVAAGDFDFSQLKLFQLSVLWRASVASGSAFWPVSIGTKHEEKIRRLLVSNDPGNPLEYCCPMLDLRYRGLGCEDFFQTPEATRDEISGQRIVKFALGGYMYIFHVSSEAPLEEVLRQSIRPGYPLHILVANSEAILRWWSTALQKAGKL